jgi:predicted ATPase
LREYLDALHDAGLIAFDRHDRSWRWELGEIRRATIPEDVLALMVSKARRLPAPTQRVLTLAACIGSSFDLETLATVGEQPLA